MQEQPSNRPNVVDQPKERSPRRRTLKSAVASYGAGAISIGVTVRDFSENGARVKLKENDFLPDHFNLFIEIDGVRVDCEAVWRRGLEVGAKFVSEVENTGAIREQALAPTMYGLKASLRKQKVSLRKQLVED